MKSISQKILGLSALLIFGAQNAHAAEESTGLVIGDTMIFSLFVLSAVVFLMIIYTQVSAMKGILENRDLWEKGSKKKDSGNGAKAGMIIGALFLSQQIYAQDGTTPPLVQMTDQMYWILIALNAFLLGIILSLYYVTKGIISSLRGVEEEEDVVSTITASLTDAIPIERESEILLDHDYDGIKELDNNLPPWWKYGFYFTIIFAFVYLFIYHVGSGDLQIAEYEKEMAEGQAQVDAYMATQANIVDEENLAVLDDAVSIESGKAVYVANCQICHGQNAEGVVGPNLTDEYWKNGGGIKNVFNTIKVGVPEKGMIPWENQLTPSQRLEVASYILSLQGTNPPNAKPAEGDLWVEEAAEPVEDVAEEVSPEEAEEGE